jgi:hypothetical protein
MKYCYKDTNMKVYIEEDSVGYYVVMYSDPSSQRSNADYLVDSLEEAFTFAEEKFGILKTQWTLKEINDHD